ncbi:MAG TPA: dethiobiotin synthase [Verrucomicrobiales bacterium]|jgi:dethiobiotin synthetase|nr:dethiobiotin synthase [Verrucomicrobiales bacterium]
MEGLFITGTDTDAGKTYVSSLIIKALREEGVDAVGYKPICCGGREDAYALQSASGGVVDLDDVNPCWMRSASAPYVAGMFENKELNIKKLLDGARNMAANHGLVLCEGVGGWKVPITKDYLVADFAKDLGWPVLLVVGNRLGALNHTALTIDSMRACGIEPVGMVFNNLSDELDTAEITNKGIAEEMTGVPVLTDVIHGQAEIEAWPFQDLMGQ